ncbi:hypothetical protein [Lacipirellula limnantheis]|uniref:Uncharacterized protein n=1 Tax=Lacipirellula limnantheis TaxID=2528024 RepID=A0A517TYG8_9BACT|nr:hypothetical protein [Lacipirellula limnantheis]QDT73423.1 hypothetical protein I41_26120 [Lacipirellula limnantheis]
MFRKIIVNLAVFAVLSVPGLTAGNSLACDVSDPGCSPTIEVPGFCDNPSCI